MLVDIIADVFSDYKKPSVKRFCDQVGTALKMLESTTPCENRAEICISLLKGAVRKDIMESNYPMVL